MTFNAWFAALSPLVKILVVLGIVVASFAVGTSFVVSTFQAWKVLANLMSRRKEDKKEKKK